MSAHPGRCWTGQAKNTGDATDIPHRSSRQGYRRLAKDELEREGCGRVGYFLAYHLHPPLRSPTVVTPWANSPTSPFQSNTRNPTIGRWTGP